MGEKNKHLVSKVNRVFRQKHRSLESEHQKIKMRGHSMESSAKAARYAIN